MSEAPATSPAAPVATPATAKATAPPARTATATATEPETLQCRLIADHHADPSAATPEEKAQIQFWWVEKMHPTKGKIKVPVPYFPAGTLFKTDVIGRIMRGQAAPDNDFTAKACGLSAAETADMQHRYKRLLAGIDPDDFELFDAGVIVGYDKDGEYRPGPNWDAFQKSRAEAAAATTTTEI